MFGRKGKGLRKAEMNMIQDLRHMGFKTKDFLKKN